MMVDVSHYKIHIITRCVRLYIVLIIKEPVLFFSTIPGICLISAIGKEQYKCYIGEQLYLTCTSQLNGEGGYI